MKLELVITGLKPSDARALREALDGVKLHYSWTGVGDGYIEEMRLADYRSIDENELVNVIKALKAATWKDEGDGGDDL